MSADVTRLTAALADRYVIDRELGQGGMATVYLAHDVRHDRKVALKVLRPELAAILGGARFLAEIKTTANLQHPHILGLFDSGEADGTVFYVMPYVEGESLRDRLHREKQLPVDDALRIAREVADALHYAHQHGIVHRDIKPENILLQGGHALVADFGIALAASRSDGGTRMTETGMSLGTPHYMSPEQAMGEKDITPKADIYALGCVTYEMLTAEPPFTGATAQAIVARVMTEQPRSLTLQRRTIPPHVEAAVQRALEKLPADRFASAAEFAAALGNPAFSNMATTASASAAAPAARGRRRSPAALAPWLVALAATGLLAWTWLTARPATGPYRFRVELADSLEVATDNVSTSLALSPDGRRLVFVGRGSHSRKQLFVRDMGILQPRALPGTEEANTPFFSPDGQWVAFFSSGKLRKVSLDGGPAMALADALNPRGGSWGPDGRIVYCNTTIGPLLSVSEGGGPIDTITALSAGETSHRFPRHLPGGEAVVFTIQGGGPLRLAAVRLSDGSVHPLIEGLGGMVTPSGHLLYASVDGSLMAIPFDADRLAVTGSPTSLLEELLVKPRTGAAEFTVSGEGTLAYVTGSPLLSLVTVDRSGAERVLRELPGADSPRFSRDGRRLVLSSTEQGTIDVRVLDLQRGTLARITHRGTNTNPEWTPDDRAVTFSSSGLDVPGYRVYLAPADGSGPPAPLLPADTGQQLEISWAPGGRLLVLRRNNRPTSMDLVVVSLDSAPGTRRIYRGSAFTEKNPAVSPDGRFLAYTSDESGHEEVYVSTFPEPSGVVQISASGGTEPRWARSGRELYYRAGDSLVSVAVTTAPQLAVGDRRVLFWGPYASGTNHAGYDVSPDNQRFAMVRIRGGRADLVVAIDWLDELRPRRASGGSR